jgi:hypothetical protein
MTTAEVKKKALSIHAWLNVPGSSRIFFLFWLQTLAALLVCALVLTDVIFDLLQMVGIS